MNGQSRIGSSAVLMVIFTVVLASLYVIPGLNPSTVEYVEAAEGVADWTILGLDVPNYSKTTHAKVSIEERKWIRHHKLEVRWQKVQPERGVFDWDYYDRQIRAVLSDGSQSILLLLGGPVPAWARDASYGRMANKAPPADLNDWYVFCGEVAGRYGAVVDFYEIWNEPGWDRDSEVQSLFGTYHFGGQVETDYLPILQAGYAAVKGRDPAGIVMCGALIDTLEDDPDTGTGLYTYLFGDDAPSGRDAAVEVTADGDIAAERLVYLGYREPEDMGGGPAGEEEARTQWYFAEGCTKAGFITWLSLENPGREDAAVVLDYYCGDGTRESKEVSVGALSRLAVAVNEEGLGVGEHDSAAGDFSIKVSSDRPVLAQRSIYLNYHGSASSATTSGGQGSAAAWSLAGSGDLSMREYVCLFNPGPRDAVVALGYNREDGSAMRNEMTVGVDARLTIALDRVGPGIGGAYPSGTDATIVVSSDEPVVAERSLSLVYDGAWAGSSSYRGVDSPRKQWSLDGGDHTMKDFIRLANPHDDPIRVELAFSTSAIHIASAEVLLPPRSRQALDFDDFVGFDASCDMIAVHPYKMPGNWGPYYANLSRAMRSIGIEKELAVTEAGWPHLHDDDPNMFSEQQQADALGDWGLGPLWDAGCRKIWIYKDMDEAPGKSWDKCYYGLFAYDGIPHPSWERYKAWQAANPSYPWLPSSLP